MKKIAFILIIFITTQKLFTNVLFWTYYDEYYLKRLIFITTIDLQLKGKIKIYTETYDAFYHYFNWKMKYKINSFPVDLNTKWKNIYYFDENGKLINMDSYSGNILKSKWNFIYNNNLLEKLIINNNDKFALSNEEYQFIYDKNNKLITIKEFIKVNVYYNYSFEYDNNLIKITLRKFIKKYNEKGYRGTDTEIESYYILKYENSNLVNLEKYNVKNKLIFSEKYIYDNNINIMDVIVYDSRDLKESHFIYEYKLDDKNNITEEYLYEKISKDYKKLFKEAIKSYEYY